MENAEVSLNEVFDIDIFLKKAEEALREKSEENEEWNKFVYGNVWACIRRASGFRDIPWRKRKGVQKIIESEIQGKGLPFQEKFKYVYERFCEETEKLKV